MEALHAGLNTAATRKTLDVGHRTDTILLCFGELIELQEEFRPGGGSESVNAAHSIKRLDGMIQGSKVSRRPRFLS